MAPSLRPEGGIIEMCGRVVQKTPMSEIRVLFETVNPVPNAAPTYNGAPTDTVPIVRLDRDGRRSLDLLRWGLIPWWSKDIKMGARCINAMAETVATKPAFRDAFAWAALHRAGRWLLRMEEDRGGEAALRDRLRGWPAARHGGAVGALEGQGVRGHDPELQHHHDGSQRALRRYSRPDAGNPHSREVGGVAGRA